MVNELVETATELETPASGETIEKKPFSEEAIVHGAGRTALRGNCAGSQVGPFEEILPPDARPTPEALDAILPPDVSPRTAPSALDAPLEKAQNSESLRPTPAPDALDAPVEEVLNPEISSVKEAFISAEEMASAPEQIEPATADTQPITTNTQAPEQIEPATADTQPQIRNNKY